MSVKQLKSTPLRVELTEKGNEQELNLELSPTVDCDNLVYDDNDTEPELHARTYVALSAMFLLNLVQVFALQGPPAVVSISSYLIACH